MRTTVHPPLAFEVLGSGLGFPEGPVVRDDGSVLVVDIDGGCVVRLAGGEPAVVASPGGGPNGMAIGPDGHAYVANNGGFLWSDVGDGIRIPIDRATHTNEPPGFEGGWLERIDLATGAVTVLHDSVRRPPPPRPQRPRVRRGRRDLVHRSWQGSPGRRRQD